MSQGPSDLVDGVPFSFFCSLLREISQAPSHKPASNHSYSNPNYPALNISRRWVNKLRKDYSNLPQGTTVTIFKLLFPDEDHYRKFDMQETRLAQNIAECFGFDKACLDNWLAENASGCLGEELKLMLQRRCPSVDDHISPLSTARVDELLDELASLSGYSDISIRRKYPKAKRRARQLVINDLFRNLSPTDAGFLTQIILKDLRPILYPLRDTHYIACLLGHNAASVKMLSKEDFMTVWDPTKWMLKAYRVRSTLSEVANGFELPPSRREPITPKIGVPVAIPKSEKGRSPRHALRFLRDSPKVWAEIKYDGERAQIHVEVQPHQTNITIFSKSKRDSTWDRKAVHECIYQALGLSKQGRVGAQSAVQSNVILDAEMVAFHGEEIDEFWTIQGLVEQTAGSIRRKRGHIPAVSTPEWCSQPSMVTDHLEMRHLGLVFFDILCLDSESLLTTPYHRRRKILEGLIQVIPGQSILSERFPIISDGPNCTDQRQIALEKIFSSVIATCQEGVVLKGGETKYHDFSVPWVKLKKDYIPNYGDTLDMVVIGVGWDRERARVLRVPPTTITTFYIGGLENAEETRRQPTRRPHFQVYFTASYVPNRQQLEEMNFTIRSSETLAYSPVMKPGALDYTFTLLPGLHPPKLILKMPLLAELYGAGFTKSRQSRHYELRFPRLTKIYRPHDRGWQDGVNLRDLHKIACDVIGRDRSSKEARDIAAEIWGKVASPGAKSSLKRKATSDLWEARLAAMDGRTRTTPSRSDSRSPVRLTRFLRTSTENVRRTLPSDSLGYHRHNPMTAHATPHSLTPTHASTQLQPLATRTKMTPQTSKISSSRDQKLSLDTCDAASSALAVFDTLKPVPPLTANASSFPEDSRTTPGSRFLENALVWFGKPRGKSSRDFVWTLKGSVCRGQQIHSVESLLAGCDWCMDARGPSWVEKGVIFVDESNAAGKDLADLVLKTINDRVPKLPPDHPRKTIWVFDVKTWTFDVEHIERRALYRLV
ncbi:putative DNA ligase N terminus [Lyophyllum shimeji]|uniref:DNA ligase N terminus n=1 Tax=Lyophyllum shimeji TaxID=47721 RepID=A0A9P3PVG9_LYOSH|nr:putative DNA ligase N terminus [Lyophyllum shimeji]